MSYRKFSSLAAFAVLFTAACNTTSQVDMQMILPAGASVMDIPEDRVFLMAAPVSQPMPAFPEDVSPTAPVHTCMEMVVDENGAVSSAVPLFGLPECPQQQASVDPRYIAAAIEAVKKWQFLAAAVCTFPPGTPMNEDCSGSDVVVAPVAIKLAYVFSFHRSGRVSAQPGRT